MEVFVINLLTVVCTDMYMYLYTGVSVDDAVLLTCDRCSKCVYL